MAHAQGNYDFATLPFYDETLDYDDAYEVPHTVYSEERPVDWRLVERPYTTTYGREPSFYGQTTHRSEFVPKSAYRERTPDYEVYELPDREEVPFYSETTNRAHYVPKEPIPQIRASSPEVERSRVPFFSETTNRETYTRKEMIEKQRRITPEARPKIPFDAITTYTDVHAPLEIKKLSPRPQTERRLQLPSLDSETTTRATYTPKKAERYRIRRSRSPRGDLPPLEGITTMQAEFTPKKADRVLVRRVRSDRPVLPPLEGVSTTKSDFTPKDGRREKPRRTRDHDLFPGRLDMERRLLDRQKVNYCPAEHLHNYKNSRARLVDGHWWFRNGRRSRSAPVQKHQVKR